MWLLKQRDGARAASRVPGAIRVGYAVETPYAFVDRAGRVSGADPETARLVASRLGWTIEWVQTEFVDLISDLQDGRFDVIAAGMFVTPQRERQLRFAAPHLHVGPGLLVPAGNPKALKGYADLRSPGVKVAVLAGSVEERRLRTDRPEPLLSLPDARAGAAAVQTGLVDALALSLPTVRSMARGLAGLEAVRAADGSPAPVAAAFRPADTGLLAAWSKAQAGVVGSEAHLRAIAPFGFEAEDVPARPVTGQRS
ncbi:transporter substrate-binding domain-containing protein [Ramlibacter sp.]|uniref:transporter substrate-binding domain-containing protein n=1 Tax=Ramlibacter sp. TaxID=1917967 RepID=UPI002BB8628E|nr:transporter substrate-binding domain-containing protein [Ramlibacter sp.]HWI81534.1 transporter substrate-binding domain-containing protein [Ramlibacter sp.]